MNVLVYSHVPLWVEFHAESVEFCLRHLQQGDNVFLLSCDGSLTSCPANPFHNLENCGRCRRQTQWTIKRILNDQVVDIRLPTNSSTLNLPQFSFGALEEQDYRFFLGLERSGLVPDWKALGWAQPLSG